MRGIKRVPQMIKFKILDLFCGAGGLSYGLDSVPEFKTLIGVDFDYKALVTFKENIKGATVICGDLTDTKVKDKIVELALEKGINMIVGGPPCQGFSLKGKNLGLNDPRNFLFLEYLKVVERVKPEVVVIENVKNLTNACKGYFIIQIKERLKSLGYIANSGILNAKDFGVPQHRERTIIIASRSKSISLPKSLNTNVTVRDAISDLAYLNSGEGSFKQNYTTTIKSKYQAEMRKGSLFLYNHMATKHSKIALKKLSLIPPEGDKKYLPRSYYGKQKFSTTWSRLKWDKQSPTIDTRFDTPSNGENSHPFLNRSITPREAARIQSFPDTFIFYGNKCSICKQIGNAVPPLLAKAIAKKIKSAYSNDSCDGNDFRLINGDAYEIADELISKGVKFDAIITDPPYRISKKNNFNTMHNRRGINFGLWDKNFNVSSWIPKYVKLLSANGSIIAFCSYRYMSEIIKSFEDSGLVFKDILIWQKSNPMPRNVNRRYVQDMEFALWAVNEKAKWAFNKPSGVPYLRSLFTFPVVSGNEKTGHPTQKSLALMEKIIEIHTNPGDIVLDPFMGSGTTGIACLKLKRRFLGIEISKTFFKIAKKRFKEFKEINAENRK